MNMIYIGPYVEFEQTTVVIQTEKKGCPTCRRKTKRPFCAQCGDETSSFLVDRNEMRVDPDKLMQETNDVLQLADVYEGFDVYFSTVVEGIERDAYFDPDDLGSVEIRPEIIEQEKQLFAQQFLETLALMKDAYGVTQIEIMWGILSYEEDL